MYLLFDVGGTRLRVGISTDGQAVSAYKMVDTPQSYAEGIALIERLALEMRPEDGFTAIAGGLPGPMNIERDQLTAAPHLVDWINRPIKADLQKLTTGPVFVENDTAIVGLGEAVAGAGKDYNLVAYVTVSTGVGGVRIVNKKLDESLYGFEPGHHTLNFNPEGEIDKLVHFEELVSGSGLRKNFSAEPSQITDPLVWGNVHKYLAVGLYNLVQFWSPQVIVLGGGLINGDLINMETVKQHLNSIPSVFPEYPVLVKSELKDIGGLYGALALIKYKM